MVFLLYDSDVLCSVCMAERDVERSREKKRFDEGEYVGGYVEEAPSVTPQSL